MSHDAPESRVTGIAALLFGAIVLLIGWDLSEDLARGTGGLHVSIELLVLLLAAIGAAMLWRRAYRARTSLRALRRDLAQAREDSERWRAQSRAVMSGLSAAIGTQFDAWGLTPAEAEIALLLLKGLSLKEIAALRETSERTVREQARSVYRKAGLNGRPALAAFFLEDLLLPPAP